MAAVEKVLNFTLDGNDGYIDIAQNVSALNRKMFRQGQQWVIESVELQTGDTGTVEIIRLPNIWTVTGAYTKAYHHWKEQQDQTAKEAGIESTKAKYRDFKIFYSGSHAAAGTGNNLIINNLNITPAAGTTQTYDWTPSTVVLPNTEADASGSLVDPKEWYLHMAGDDQTVANDSKGLVKAYAQSRSRPQSPDPNIVNVAGGGLYAMMEDVGNDDQEIINNYQDNNNEPPYLLDMNSGDEFYPGGSNNVSTISECRLISAGGGNIRTVSGGFIANCGLLYLSNSGINEGVLKIRLAADDKGYITRSMLEAN